MGIAFNKMIEFINSNEWKEKYPNTEWAEEMIRGNTYLKLTNSSLFLVLVEVSDHVLKVETDFLLVTDANIARRFRDFWYHNAPDLYLISHDNELIAVPVGGKFLRSLRTDGEKELRAYYVLNAKTTSKETMSFYIDVSRPFRSDYRYSVVKQDDGWHLKVEYFKHLSDQVLFSATEKIQAEEDIKRMQEKAERYQRLEEEQLVSIKEWFDKEGYKTRLSIDRFTLPIGGSLLTIALRHCELNETCYLFTKRNVHVLTNQNYDDRIYEVKDFDQNGNPIVPLLFLKEIQAMKKMRRYKDRLR